jgi:hypothetical protein
MSFKLFIYYSSICGAWAAFVGWAFGRMVVEEFHQDAGALVRTLLHGMILGAAVGMAVGFVDALWNRAGRQAGPLVMRSLVVGASGCVCGLIGSTMGQFLFRMTQINLLFIFGWGLTGLLIGASVGVLDVVQQLGRGKSAKGHMRKVANGLLGGFLGGLFGGLLSALAGFTLSKAFSKPADQLLSSSAWGFVALGTSIGLFIGLAQVILKEAWVKVESGFRPGREILLVKEEVFVGRAESCDIGLFGDSSVERTHARILRKDNGYLLVDEGTAAGTYLNDIRIMEATNLQSGDMIRLGHNVLRFGERQRRGARSSHS